MRTRGFTLIELLVVMAILSILTALTFPAMRHIRQQASTTRCRSNLRSIGAALVIYLNHSENLLPTVATLPSLGLDDRPRIVDVLAPHLDSTEVFQCPDDSKGYYRTEGSSYQFNTHLNGQKLNATRLARRLGESRTWVMFDYEPFHGEPGEPGAANYLFADGRVSDLR